MSWVRHETENTAPSRQQNSLSGQEGSGAFCGISWADNGASGTDNVLLLHLLSVWLLFLFLGSTALYTPTCADVEQHC